MHDDVQRTYGELNAQANQLARYLCSIGIGADARVALLVERSVTLIVAVLAIIKCGAVYVPLDQHAPAERQELVLRDCGAEIVLSVRSQAFPETASVRRVNLDELVLAEYASDDLGLPIESETAAYVMYTSGSTGRPKGVVVPHRAIGRLVLNNGYAQFSPSDRVAFTSNPAFDASTMEVWAPLLNGGRIVVIDQATLLAPERLAHTLQLHRVTVLSLVVGIFNQYADVLREVFPQLKYLIVGGDALDVDITFGIWRNSPPQQLLCAYGPTESTTFAATCDIAHVAEDSRSIPIGRPIANTRVYVLDAYREPVPIGVTGELHIGGAGVALGYLNRPELTAERFLASPFVEGDRLYKTGDLGRYLPDGTIEFLGRNDFQVKIRGFRVELGEIEARLREHAAVREAVVLAREDIAREKRLVAYYTAPAGEVGVAELRAHLAAVLPEYMVPAAYVRVESFPLTPNGKVDRAALPAPDAAAYVERAYEPPLGEIEETLAQIWCDVLALDRVGRHDNFFELNGHSLLAVRVLSHIRQALQVEIGLTQFFASPVLRDIGRLVAEATRGALPAIVPAVRSEPPASSFAQQRLWFLAQIPGVSQAYHIPLGFRLSGELNRVALRRALDRLVFRHEALRTSFAVIGGEPFQRVAAAESGFALVVEDLRDTDAMAELERALAEEASAAFDLEAGPLIRGRLIRVDRAEHVLLITMHHIVSDGWSMDVLLRELSALYRAYREDAADPLPALPIQYADYAVWQRSQLSSAVLQNQIAYWQRTLAGIAPVHQIPTDRARPAQQDYAGGRIRVELDATLTAKLRALSLRHGTTLFTTLLTGWSILVGRLSGQTDVVIGTPVANRTRAEVEGLIGCFVNTLALRLDLSGSPRVSALLDRVKAQTLAAQEHQDLPFEQVVEAVQPPRSLAHAPLVPNHVRVAEQRTKRRGLSGAASRAGRGTKGRRKVRSDAEPRPRRTIGSPAVWTMRPRCSTTARSSGTWATCKRSSPRWLLNEPAEYRRSAADSGK